MQLVRFAVLAVALLGFMVSAAAAAEPVRACFAPADLEARAGEEIPVKGDRRFDAAESVRLLAGFTSVATELRGAVRRVELPKGRKLIALTLDLCEQPGEVAGYDGAIFDYLRSQGVKATLFAGGKWMRSHEGRFRQLLADPLFEIGNHATAHRNLRLLSGAALEAEIAGPQRAYEAIRADAAANQCLAPRIAETSQRLTLFRFPYGACNDNSLKAVNDAGLLAIQWDVSTGDPSPGTSAAAIADSMVHGVRPGSIIIAHANGRGFHTAAGLPLAIPRLKAAGYQFVTVSELLAAGKPVIVSSCYDNKPGDTDRYDHPLGLLAKAQTARQHQTATGSGESLPWFTSATPAKEAHTRSRRPAALAPERLPWQ